MSQDYDADVHRSLTSDVISTQRQAYLFFLKKKDYTSLDFNYVKPCLDLVQL